MLQWLAPAWQARSLEARQAVKRVQPLADERYRLERGIRGCRGISVACEQSRCSGHEPRRPAANVVSEFTIAPCALSPRWVARNCIVGLRDPMKVSPALK